MFTWCDSKCDCKWKKVCVVLYLHTKSIEMYSICWGRSCFFPSEYTLRDKHTYCTHSVAFTTSNAFQCGIFIMVCLVVVESWRIHIPQIFALIFSPMKTFLSKTWGISQSVLLYLLSFSPRHLTVDNMWFPQTRFGKTVD